MISSAFLIGFTNFIAFVTISSLAALCAASALLVAGIAGDAAGAAAGVEAETGPVKKAGGFGESSTFFKWKIDFGSSLFRSVISIILMLLSF